VRSTPRSLALRALGYCANDHPLVVAGKSIGKKLYGSPTTSDQALIPVPSIKMGPGDSARSHSADEFIYVHEIDRYNELSAKQKLMVIDFLNQSTIIDINQEIKNNVVKLSKLYKLKLPDCIILSTGIHLDLPLLSSDKDLIKVKEVSVLYYEK
jgi:predicted nucleic acid-binding protein